MRVSHLKQPIARPLNPARQTATFSRASTPPSISSPQFPSPSPPTTPRYPRNRVIMSSPLFWSTPLKYCRWAAREKPALFWSVVIGAAGPLAMPIGPPIRRWLGDVDPAPVPVTYPVPAGPRKQLTGYDDE